MNEFDLIARYFDRAPVQHAELGIGDDAALLDMAGQTLVVCTDMLVQGRHFYDDADPESVGHKSLVVNLSDLAAMGAQPVGFTLALALPEPNEQWLAAFAKGLFAAADHYDCELVGGDTTRGPLTISITAHGRLPPGSALRRDRAEPGDDVWVSGFLGGAGAAVDAREQRVSQIPVDVQRRLDWPSALIELGVHLRHLASAAIDISDGLVSDLAHIADRSRAAMSIVAADVPVDPSILEMLDADKAMAFALNGGDDYELAFCAAPENRVAIAGIATRLNLNLSRIGRVHAGQGIHITDPAGKPYQRVQPGYDHFASN